MDRASSAIRALARQLLDCSAEQLAHNGDEVDRVIGATRRIRIPLVRVVGAAGFSALLSRALSLAKKKTPALDSLRVEVDGTLTAPDRSVSDLVTQEERMIADELLLEELISLLVTFIGEPITNSLIREAWPEISINAVATEDLK